MIQVCYEWSLNQVNKGIVITASKSPLPVRTTLEQGRKAIEEGAIVLQETGGRGMVVFGVTGDMVLLPVFEAAKKLEEQGIGSRIVGIVNPRRLYRPTDVAWDTVSQPDGNFISRERFDAMFHGDVLIGVSGGPGAMLEPLLLRSAAMMRDVYCWKRGETTASPNQLFDFNAMNADAMAKRAVELLG
jgi:phosphoketolase